MDGGGVGCVGGVVVVGWRGGRVLKEGCCGGGGMQQNTAERK